MGGKFAWLARAVCERSSKPSLPTIKPGRPETSKHPMIGGPTSSTTLLRYWYLGKKSKFQREPLPKGSKVKRTRLNSRASEERGRRTGTQPTTQSTVGLQLPKARQNRRRDRLRYQCRKRPVRGVPCATAGGRAAEPACQSGLFVARPRLAAAAPRTNAVLNLHPSRL